MANVTFGPFLVNNGQTGLAASKLEHTGYSMEISSDEFAQNICLYRQINDWQPNAIRLDDFYVSVDQVPFDLLPVAEPQKQSSQVGPVVTLEAMLCSLYVKHEVTRSITSALEEFRQHLLINHCTYPRRDDGAKLVHPALAKAGFEVIKFFPYGRTLSVQFGWVYPQDRQDAKAKLNVYAGTIEFKPKPDRTLDKGQWNIPGETSVAYLLTQILETLSGESPGLLSELGTQAALDSFKWTKVSLLTAQEAKLARINFVRKHPDLHSNHQALAKALKNAELYSDTAEVYAIRKQVPRLIREATGK
jgi:hypothetical protein